MVPKRDWFLRLARVYVRWRFRRVFAGVRVHGVDEAREVMSRGAVVVASNHVCFWDALLLVILEEALGCDGYALMDRANLKRFPFFAWAGAIPLGGGDGRRLLGDLRAATARLTGPGRAVWIFPQGRQSAAHLPLVFQGGVAALARLAGATVVPMAVRYDFTEGPRPWVHVVLGEPLTVAGASRSSCALLERAVAEGLALIDEELASHAHASESGRFVELLGGRGRRVPLASGALARLVKAVDHED